MDCTRKNRHGHRDATMVLVAYRHRLRASEVCDLQWHQIELDQGRMHVHRAKNGTPSASLGLAWTYSLVNAADEGRGLPNRGDGRPQRG
jgi:integrase